MARHNNRTLRLVDQFYRLGNGCGRKLRRARCAEVFKRTDRSRRPVERFAELDVLGHVDQYWSWTSTKCQLEGFMDGVRQVFNVAHQEIVFGDRLRDTNHIGLLEGVAPNKWTRYL